MHLWHLRGMQGSKLDNMWKSIESLKEVLTFLSEMVYRRVLKGLYVSMEHPHITLHWSKMPLEWKLDVLGVQELLKNAVFFATCRLSSLFGLSPENDQHQFSPADLNILSREKVMRINEMIICRKMLCP